MPRPFVPRDLAFGPLGEHARLAGRSEADVGLVLGHRGECLARRRWVERLKREGLTVWQADELATRLGAHPLAVWGVAWSEAREAPTDVEVIFRRLGRWCAARRRGDRIARRMRGVQVRWENRRDGRGPHRCASDGCACSGMAA